MAVSLCDCIPEIFWWCIVFPWIWWKIEYVASLEFPLFGFVLPSGAEG